MKKARKNLFLNGKTIIFFAPSSGAFSDIKKPSITLSPSFPPNHNIPFFFKKVKKNRTDYVKPIRFFEGVGGVEEIYKEMLSYPNQEILAWMCDSPMLELSGEFWDFFANFYIPQRKKRRINLRSINSDEEGIEAYQKRGQAELRETKLVDHNEFPIKASINLFGGRNISIVSFREKIGLIIESEKIYMTLKSIFEMNWKSLG